MQEAMMVCPSRVTYALGVSLVLATAMNPGLASGQAPMQPVNDLPNPYEATYKWGQMPPGRDWGSSAGIDVAPDGRSIWIAERCGANSCMDRATGQMSTLPPILRFDLSGKLLASFGAGMIIWPHGLDVDHEGNVWVTDGQDDAPRPPAGTPGAATRPGPPSEAKRGHQVFKFSPDGRPLMTIGRPGGAALPDCCYEPNDVLVTPSGDIFVAQGHDPGSPNSSVLKFSKDGTFVKVIAALGPGPGQVNEPHGLVLDPGGRLFVADRSNDRVQILDQDGKYLDAWHQFSRPSGMFITPDYTLYVTDGESGSVAKAHGAWKRGLRIGSAKDGKVQYFIPDPVPDAVGPSAAEGVTVDADGTLYGAEVGRRQIVRYVRKSQ